MSIAANYPLYDGAAPGASEKFPKMNYGLWFDRFFSAYEKNFEKTNCELYDKGGKDKKVTPFFKWQEHFAKPYSDQESLHEKAKSIALLAQGQQGQSRIYHCEGNFLTGIGNAHPMENGFLWHQTLGMPYLPGSAVKGLLRAVIEVAYEESDKDALLKLWFGTVQKEDVAEESGLFIFMDALPVKPCQLRLEVMTPHMGKWYEKGGQNPLTSDSQPGDWHAPIPVTYWVARNLYLQFAILPRPGMADDSAAEKALAALWQVLDYGLKYFGAGAKTAIGFGRMERDEESKKREKDIQEELQSEREQAQIQSLSPVMQEIEMQRQKWKAKHEKMRGQKEAPNASIHNRARELAKKAHESEAWSMEEKREAALLIEEWIPRLVNNIDAKEIRKQLKLGLLKGG